MTKSNYQFVFKLKLFDKTFYFAIQNSTKLLKRLTKKIYVTNMQINKSWCSFAASQS
jgi:hypothetical protein